MIPGHGLAATDLARLIAHAEAAWRAVPDSHPLAAERESTVTHLAELSATPDDPRWREPVDSPVGLLPKVTALHATGYVIAQQLRADRIADDDLLEIGVAALTDSIGALATRNRLVASVTVATTTTAWTITCHGDGWSTTDAPPSASASITTDASRLIDITGGEVGDVTGMLLRREIRFTDPAGLLPVADVLASTPGLPGGAALRSGLAMLRLTGSVLGKLRFSR